ncbi:MAG: ATPase [Prevotella sp.]|nr:ATPase [Prevotella sp.]
MIIKEIRIKNFRSYYGDSNVFEFSDGLTLILGDNGDGKTTFFEALEWLFRTEIDRGSQELENVSEMRKSKLEIGEQDEVCVFMSFEHDGMKSVEKSFTFERTGESSFSVGKVSYTGYEDTDSGREQVSGKLLINRCYDAFIQRFSMFKGESRLDVFDDKTALKALVDKFSDIKAFDELVELTSDFKKKSETAYLKEMKSDEKVSKEANSLELKIKHIADNIAQKKKDIREKQTSIDVYNSRLKELEKNQETSERYKEIEDRRKTQQDKKTKLLSQINMVDYNHALLDKFWILAPYPRILQEFKQKCSAFSKEKRRQEREFDREQAEAIGKLKAVKEIQGTLINGSTELPWYLPDQETMEEMIHDHICKVCGRPAPEGSEAYEFMIKKLEDYKKHVEAKIKKEIEEKKLEDKTLFKNNHIESLHSLSISLSGNNESTISSISIEINERVALVSRLREELKSVEGKLQDIVDEKSRLLIQAGNVSESVLEKDFKDIKGLFEQKGRAEIRLLDITNELSLLQNQMTEYQKELDDLNPSSGQVKILRDVHRALDEISKAFANAKEANLRRFLHELEDKANEYLDILSANDFHGMIRLHQTADESTEIKLFSSNKSEITKPSGSQKTEMYISVLFAISDFTKEKRDEDYPLIFDAATSSFGDSKEDEFYNVIDRLDKQCIIVTKDFMTKGLVRTIDIDRLSCPVYRIKKADGFDKNNMATIRTIVTKLKD